MSTELLMTSKPNERCIEVKGPVDKAGVFAEVLLDNGIKFEAEKYCERCYRFFVHSKDVIKVIEAFEEI